MKLYSFTGSCGLAANIALEWADANYSVELISKEDTKKPDFLAINPLGKAPALTEGDWAIYENAAILGYLAEKFPAAKLYGDGTLQSRVEVDRWLGMVNSDLHPAYKPLFGATAYLEDDAAIAKTKDQAIAEITRYFEQVNHQLKDNDWIAGSRSIADAYLFVTLMWAGMLKIDLSQFKNITRYKAALDADTGVQQALKAQGLA